MSVKTFVNEFWTPRQRQASSIHEISYRACFKPQLPRFFIEKLTKEGDIVFDPFSGRGTTIIESVLMGRVGYANDVNPLSKILAEPRIFPVGIDEIERRLKEIDLDTISGEDCDIDLSMFYETKTLGEIISLKNYFIERVDYNKEDIIDKWIRMIATNRLTGHSPGFFSVYTLPPNQAVSQKSQQKINEKKNQKPEYRNVKNIILKKADQLLSGLNFHNLNLINKFNAKSKFFTEDAKSIPQIESNSVKLTVTSPPFLDIVQYSKDNWLRCWFNNIEETEISKKITMSKTINEWNEVMKNVFDELFRITKLWGWVAFEVGEIRKGKIKIEEEILKIGIDSGFKLFGVIINSQKFTKTANIWGINNNEEGTNTNRIVLFYKGE